MLAELVAEAADAALQAAGLAGAAYLAGATLLGLALTGFSLNLALARDQPAARALFLASVVYLPALSCLLLAARF